VATMIGSTSTSYITISPYLQIGPIILNEDEHPSNLKFGAISKGVTHDLIGGTREDQALGISFKDVMWTGRMFSQNGDILPRIRLFDAMLATQAEQRLKFVDERYDCRIIEFEPDYNHRNYADYTITVRVIRDASGRFTSAPSQSAIDAQTTALVQTATLNAALIAAAYPPASPPSQLSPLRQALQALTSVITAISPLAPAIGSSGITQALSSTAGALETANALQTQVGTSNNVTAVAAAQITASLTLLQANLNTGQTAASIIVTGGTLTQICAQYYGDPTVAPQVQAANNLPSTTLPPGVQTKLLMPPLVTSTVPG
jgi:hypothetical protein